MSKTTKYNQVRVELEINGELKTYWIGLASDLEVMQLQNIISDKISTL